LAPQTANFSPALVLVLLLVLAGTGAGRGRYVSGTAFWTRAAWAATRELNDVRPGGPAGPARRRAAGPCTPPVPRDPARRGPRPQTPVAAASAFRYSGNWDADGGVAGRLPRPGDYLLRRL